jgi:hypothetical protein
LGSSFVFDPKLGKDSGVYNRGSAIMMNMIQVGRAMNNSIHENVFMLWIQRIIKFYLDGFRAMTLGKTLWIVILIKLFIMFAVLKFFFFSDFLQSNFTTDSQRAEYVLERITLQTKLNTGTENE